MQFGEKTNGQKFQKTDKCSFRKKQTDKHCKKKQNAVLRSQVSKNESTNFSTNLKSKCSLEKNERTNISKNSKMEFGEKTNGQTFRKTDKCSFRKKQTDKHFEKKQMEF